MSNSPRATGNSAAGRGHPSVRLSLRGDYAYAIGLAIMGDVVAMTMVDFAGNILGSRRSAMPDMSRAAVCQKLQGFKDELLAETGIAERRLIGAGLGISGFFVGERRWINPPAYLDDWALVDIEPIIGDCLELPVMFDNDAAAAALGEALFGVGRRHRTFVYLHLTNGFGGGVIVDGRLFNGAHGNVGDFAAVWTAMDIEVPHLDMLRDHIGARGHAFATIEDMVRVITPETPGVAEWIDRASEPYAKMAMVLTACLDPELIVIGGRTPRAIGQALADRIVIPPATMRRNRPPPRPRLVPSEAPGDPVALGAAAMPLQAAFFR